MNKNIWLWIILLVLIFALYVPIGDYPAYAKEDEEEVTKKIEDEIDKRVDELNLNEFELFFQQLEDENLKSIGASIKQIIMDIIHNKKKISFDTLFGIVLNLFLKELLKAVPMVVTIIIIAIFYGLFSNLTSGFAKSSTKQIIYLVCYGAIIAILGYAIASSLISVKNTIARLDKVMSLAFPILLTLTSALGGAVSAGVYQPVMTIMTTVMIKIINVVIIPLFIATVIFGIVGNLSDNVKLDKLTKTTKSFSEWTLGIMFALFISYITVQGIAGSAFDTVSIKSAKFALASYVPILGGYLSEGFDLVMASCVVIKNALGLCSIIILFFIIMAPLVKLLVLIFALRIASSIIEPISDEKMSSLLYTTSQNLVTLVVILLGISFLFFVVVMLIIATCNFGVI